VNAYLQAGERVRHWPESMADIADFGEKRDWVVLYVDGDRCERRFTVITVSQRP
jgi:hypothetical protein